MNTTAASKHTHGRSRYRLCTLSGTAVGKLPQIPWLLALLTLSDSCCLSHELLTEQDAHPGVACHMCKERSPCCGPPYAAAAAPHEGPSGHAAGVSRERCRCPPVSHSCHMLRMPRECLQERVGQSSNCIVCGAGQPCSHPAQRGAPESGLKQEQHRLAKS